MDEPQHPAHRLRTVAWLVIVPAVALLALPLLLLEIGPAYQARFAGTPGVFTAADRSCDEVGSCRWTGDFRSDDGSIRREDVVLIGAVGVSDVGDRAPAVDIGRNNAVYPAGGGWNWAIITGLLVGTCAALALWSRSVRRWHLRRRADRDG